MSYLLTQYGVGLEIDTTPNALTRNWVEIGDGFNNLAEALNEQVQEYFFLNGKGYGASEVTGIHPTLTLSGVRKVGDAAQDYIFGNRFSLMGARKTNVRYSLANGDGSITRWTAAVTLTNISAFGGATTDGAAVSVDLAFYGAPTVENLSTSSMSLTSVAGTSSGYTKLTATPTYPDAGCLYVYAYGDTAPAAAAGSVLTGWSVFSNGADYPIASGKYVTVAMVNASTYAVMASASATVVAKS